MSTVSLEDGASEVEQTHQPLTSLTAAPPSVKKETNDGDSMKEVTPPPLPAVADGRVLSIAVKQEGKSHQGSTVGPAASDAVSSEDSSTVKTEHVEMVIGDGKEEEAKEAKDVVDLVMESSRMSSSSNSSSRASSVEPLRLASTT